MNDGCRYCYDHTVDPELTEENDFSSVPVGESNDYFRLSIDTGGKEPPRIEAWAFIPYIGENRRVAVYRPKYCPECGRRLREENSL